MKSTSGTTGSSREPAPRMSVVVIVYRMARQAMNTLYTLSTAYQREVLADDYEVVVVENASDSMLDASAVASLAGNFRYISREEPGVSPAAAINAGLSACRGGYVGLMIDGARMLTPRVLRYALDAYAISSGALVAVPGYHLGYEEHHQAEGYDEASEQALLASVDWRTDGYELFRIACFSGSNATGFFHPWLESNCMFAPAAHYARIGGADESFQLLGGGALNLHMYRSLGLLPETRLFILPGEGSFHQFHGGVTTARKAEREALIDKIKAELHAAWGGNFYKLRRQPCVLGAIPGQAMPFLEESAVRGHRRYHRRLEWGVAEWPDDDPAEFIYPADPVDGN